MITSVLLLNTLGTLAALSIVRAASTKSTVPSFDNAVLFRCSSNGRLVLNPFFSKVKENQEKDKIGSKPDKNGNRVEAEKSLKQLQWIKEEKPKKTQKEWS
nr:hypothetical protein [Tanacetum cinerariifolium]